jgi:hypothetical protein
MIDVPVRGASMMMMVEPRPAPQVRHGKPHGHLAAP